MNTLHLGSQAEFVRITISEQFNAEGWSQADFEVGIQCFHGNVQAFLERSDLERLLSELQPLHSSLTGKAELSPIEAQVGLTLAGNGRGAIKVSGFTQVHRRLRSSMYRRPMQDQCKLFLRQDTDMVALRQGRIWFSCICRGK